MRNNTSLTNFLIAGDDGDRRQRKGNSSKAKEKKTPQVSYLAFFLLGKFRPLLYLGWDSLKRAKEKREKKRVVNPRSKKREKKNQESHLLTRTYPCIYAHLSIYLST